ncbi:MAG: VCBS repeat-containing protein, partial [Acidobacteria bacterium]|nr:VCBS repeat-containing protein [Acidobacteriota bacterium]
MRRLFFFWIGLLPVLAIGADSPAGVRFVDAAKESGLTQPITCGNGETNYIIETVCSGASFLDYDNDGWIDIYLVNGSRLGGFEAGKAPGNFLYRNLGNGRFADVTAKAGVGDTAWGQGVSYGDYDNDGDDDIYVTNWGPNRLYRNNGDGTFTDVAAATGTADPGWGTSSAFGDYDNDGDLDLYVANYINFDPARTPRPGENQNCKFMGADVMCGPRGLEGAIDHLYRNDGRGAFTDVTAAAGLRVDAGHYGLGVIFADYDNDGDLDLYVANDSQPNFLYRNDGNGHFTDVGYRSGVAFNEEGREQAGMGVDFGDYDNDGDLDLFVTNFSQDTNTLYENQGKGTFADRTYLMNLGADSLHFLGWGTAFFDADNDGWL